MAPDHAPARPADDGIFLEIRSVPVHVGVLWPSREAARACPRGDVLLRFDPRTGFIDNAAFDPSLVDYGLRYDNALHFSPYFQAFEDRLARRLVERYDVRGKHVVEIGAGGGRFIGLLCELGDNRGTGYDPSHDPRHADPLLGARARVERRPYGADAEAADLVVCRHVLEHIPDPRAFVRMLRQSLAGRPDAVVYCEVPNSYLILRELSIWDVIYEHCTYFTQGTLARLFASCGFDVTGSWETYARQFIAIDAKPARGEGRVRVDLDDPAELRGAAQRFAEACRERVEGWRRELARLAAAGRRVALWGAGARGVNFLNLADAAGTVRRVVDINPRKHGLHVAGTGQRVEAPDSLREDPPDVVVVMNPIYLDEIRGDLRAMGLAPEVRRA